MIEGAEPSVRTLYAHIERDYRHKNLVKLADGPIAHRNFPSWVMGFKVLTPAAFAQVAGYINPTSPAFGQALGETNDELIRNLLATFRPTASDQADGSSLPLPLAWA